MLLQHILITIVCCKLLTTSSSGEDSCIEDKTSGHCYQIVDSRVKWSQAFSICKLDGGNLAIIESAEEQTFISDRIRERKFEIGGLWIGSDKVHPEEKRTWINGEKFSYVNWANGQPDNRPDENKCAVIDPDDGTWHGYPCSNSLGYICENTLILNGNEVKSYIKDINTGHYYKIYRNSSTRATWNTSYDICRKDGGMLIIIESAEEQKFIQDQVKKIQSRLWIGSDNLFPEQERKWANGNKFTFVNWAQGEPSNDQNCTEIRTINNMWYDYECSRFRGYICEKTLPGISESNRTVIGVVVGSLLVLVLGVLIFYLIKKRKLNRQNERDEAYEQTLEMNMNNVEHVYNRVPDILGT